MNIELKKFGTMLVSRPGGREAWLAAQAYVLPQQATQEEIVVDFQGVDVLSPSWADEFISKLVERFGGDRVQFVHTENASVKATLKTLNLQIENF